MSLEVFLHNLHFDTEKASPPNWEVDWQDAPLPYKLYRDLPVVPLSSEVPLTLGAGEVPLKPNLYSIGHFLWYVFGLTQFSQLTFATEQGEAMQSARRFVPSGGALYPNELYIYLKLADLPPGLYHYDVAHHCLILVREGDFDSYLASALGNRYDGSACFGTIFVSTMFWKNFFKYNNFSYRLQGLDAGVLIGQLLEVAKRFGFASKVYFQFLDRAINHLLGLSEQEESVYAIIPLSVELTIPSVNKGTSANLSASQLYRELPSLQHHHYVRSRKIREYPMLMKMNEASMLESTQSFQTIKMKEYEGYEGETVALPQVRPLSADFTSACQKRYSPDMDFTLGKLEQWQLATLLQEATTAFLYQNDLDEENQKQTPRVSVYGCFHQIEGLPDGAYYYDSAAHLLQQISLGDQRLRLQAGMPHGNIDLLQVPLCLHVAGDKDHFKSVLGYRGYRIQQMEAGMLVQRLLLVASAMGIGGHPLLGFDVNFCDEMYKMNPQGKTSLIQIPVGPYRHRTWLKGSIRS